jgi:hypothetical protein
MWIWYGIVNSPHFSRVAARLKGPTIQTATAYACQPGLQKSATWGQIDT